MKRKNEIAQIILDQGNQERKDFFNKLNDKDKYAFVQAWIETGGHEDDLIKEIPEAKVIVKRVLADWEKESQRAAAMKRTIISIDLGAGQVGKARKAALERLADEANCNWGGSGSIGRYICQLADNRAMLAYFCTGAAGSVFQLEDRRYADTVGGVTSEDLEPHEALDKLSALPIELDWVAQPLLGHLSHIEMQQYCDGEKLRNS